MKRNTLNRTQQAMKTNWTTFDSRKQSAADDKERNIERTIVIGTLLILALVAVVCYLRLSNPGQRTDDYPTSTLQPITRY